MGVSRVGAGKIAQELSIIVEERRAVTVERRSVDTRSDVRITETSSRRAHRKNNRGQARKSSSPARAVVWRVTFALEAPCSRESQDAGHRNPNKFPFFP